MKTSWSIPNLTIKCLLEVFPQPCVQITETGRRKVTGKEIITYCELFCILSASLRTLLKPSHLIFMSELSNRHYYLHFTRNPTSGNLNKFTPSQKLSRVNSQDWVPYSKSHCCIESTLAISIISRTTVVNHIKCSYYTKVTGQMTLAMLQVCSVRDPGERSSPYLGCLGSLVEDRYKNSSHSTPTSFKDPIPGWHTSDLHIFQESSKLYSLPTRSYQKSMSKRVKT